MEKAYFDKKGESKSHHSLDEENIISKALEKSIENGDAHKLSHSLRKLMKELEEHLDIKEEFLFSLYELANGKHFDECTATKLVEGMGNVDGTKGEHWSIKESLAIMKKFRFEPTDHRYNEYDWYVVLNMMFSDYADVLGNKEEIHAAMANAYFNGPDEKEGKAWIELSHKLFDEDKE